VSIDIHQLKELDTIYMEGVRYHTGTTPEYSHSRDRPQFTKLIEKYSWEKDELGDRWHKPKAYEFVKRALKVWLYDKGKDGEQDPIGKYSGFKLTCFANTDWNRILLRMREINEEKELEKRRLERQQQHLLDTKQYEGKEMNREEVVDKLRELRNSL
jgi:hypothetical protein